MGFYSKSDREVKRESATLDAERPAARRTDAERQAARDARDAADLAAVEAQHRADVPAGAAERIVDYVEVGCARLKFWAAWYLGRLAIRDVSVVDEDVADADGEDWESALHGIGPLADALAESSRVGDRQAFDRAYNGAAEQIRECKGEAESMFLRAVRGKGGDVADAFAQCAETDEGPMLGTLHLIGSMDETKRRMEDGELAPGEAQLQACETLGFGWTLGGLVGTPGQ